MDIANRKHYSLREVAAITCVTADTVRIWCHAGKLPSVKVGGRFRVLHSDLVQFVKPVADRQPHPERESEPSAPPQQSVSSWGAELARVRTKHRIGRRT